MFLLVPFAPAAHAASGASISVTPTTGTPGYDCYDGDCNFETTVTVTGSGFPSGQGDIDICFLETTQTATTGCSNGLFLGANGGLFDFSIEGPAGYVTADANGNFQVQFYAPIAEADTYNVYAVYTPSSGVVTMTSPVVFTLNQAIAVEDQTTGNNSGIPGQAFDIIVVGMDYGENLEFVGTFFVGTNWVGATAVVGTTTTPAIGGSCAVTPCQLPGVFEVDDGAVENGAFTPTATTTYTVPSLASGTNTVSVIGESSGFTASSTFIAKPAIALWLAPVCVATPPTLTPIISVQTAPGNKFCISGVGFAKSATIAAAGSVTVGGASTIESAISTTSTGSFAPVEITLASSSSIGPLTISFNGKNFNFENGNIIAPAVSAEGILLGSNPGAALTSVQDSSTYTTSGDVGDTVYIFGFGYSVGATPSFTFGGEAWAAIGGTTLVTEDGNGAFEASFVVPPLPFTQSSCPAGTCYFIVDGSAVTNLAPEQTFTITPEVSFGTSIGSTTTADNSFGFPQTLVADGFATTDTVVTVTMNGVAWAECPSAKCTMNFASWLAADGAEVTLTLPVIGSSPSIEFPGGTYTMNMSGSTSGNWGVTTNQLTIEPIQAASGIPNTPYGTISALSVNSGNTGTSVALLSATTGGLHGLAANTAYTVMWDGTDNVASFTSTATGEVPIGVSFAVPAGVSGYHIVDVQTAGVSALYGNQLTSNQQWGGTCAGEPCDLIFYLIPVLTATPSLVWAGQTATVAGSGLPTSTLLYIVGPNSVSYASFTSTAVGGVPSGVTFTVPAQPTNAGEELGSLVTWFIEDSSGAVKGELQYVYGASVSLSASSGAAGASVTLTANGLNAADAPYSVVFNCVPNTITAYSCTGTSSGSTPANIIVGALIPNALGTASTTITIPTSATAGTYVIQVVGSNDNHPWDLAIPATFTVGAPSGIGVTTLTPGSPSQSTINGQPDITLTYTNTLSTSSITIVGYAVVSNALGQVVLYTTGSATLAPSGSQTLYFVLAGLPAGSYTVSIYAISSTGLVVSTTTSATAVIS